MSARLPLTLACGDYEIVRALKDGTVKPDGIELTVLTQMDSNTRHHRFLKDREFDVAELSSCGYIAGRGKGQPIVALPVFLHRRFRHGFIFINTRKGITKPTDLIRPGYGLGLRMVTSLGFLGLDYAWGESVSPLGGKIHASIRSRF